MRSPASDAPSIDVLKPVQEQPRPGRAGVRFRPETDPPPLADEDAAAIFTALDRNGVAYVVIGGMAAAM